MDYYVVKGFHLKDFEKQVKEKLAKGWELVGGVSTVNPFGKVWYYQAMIKE